MYKPLPTGIAKESQKQFCTHDAGLDPELKRTEPEVNPQLMRKYDTDRMVSFIILGIKW